MVIRTPGNRSKVRFPSGKAVSQLMGLESCQVLDAGPIEPNGFLKCKKKRSDVQRKTTGAADEEHIGKI